MSEKEEYLGDGLYASHDGYMVYLRAPRYEGDHWVGMEPEVLNNFLLYIEKLKKGESC